MAFKIERNDITKVKADVIINTANPNCIVGTGIDQQIYDAAGYTELLAERKIIGSIEPGQSKATSSYKLKTNGVKYIIHTVGIGWGCGNGKEEVILRSCYSTSLNLAKSLGCKKIAIPLLATGNYGYPKDFALKIASDEINSFLLQDDVKNDKYTVKLIVFDSQSYLLSEKIHDDIECFIDENYIEECSHKEFHNDYTDNIRFARNIINQSSAVIMESCNAVEKSYGESSPIENFGSMSVEEFISQEQDKLNFQNILQMKIADKNLSNAEVYNKANVDKKFFSKIISHKDYVPKKDTVIAFGLALELNYEDFELFLASAGYAFKASSLFDTIIKYCILNRIYNLFDVNTILFDYNLPTF